MLNLPCPVHLMSMLFYNKRKEEKKDKSAIVDKKSEMKRRRRRVQCFGKNAFIKDNRKECISLSASFCRVCKTASFIIIMKLYQCQIYHSRRHAYSVHSSVQKPKVLVVSLRHTLDHHVKFPSSQDSGVVPCLRHFYVKVIFPLHALILVCV